MRCAPSLFAFLLTACGASDTPRTAEPARGPAPSACEDAIVRYRARLAAATNACSSDADCGIYGGLDPDAVCGGVTDRATADALEALAADSGSARCPAPGYSCPPILPRCEGGVCR